MYHTPTLYEQSNGIFIRTSPDMYTYKYRLIDNTIIKVCLFENCLELAFHKCSFCKYHKRELKYNNRLYRLIHYVKQKE